MIDDMNNRISSVLMRCQIPVVQEVQEAAPEQHAQRYHEQKEDLEARAQQAAAHQDTREDADQANHTPYVAERMPRPNDPCPCGSGKKFKNCHGKNI